jgi:predicted RNA binding protein YcfA (HicA-like mRNA interferase family)
MFKEAGFVLDPVKGSDHIFLHPQSKKRVVVPHPKKDLPFGTARIILKQAGIE